MTGIPRVNILKFYARRSHSHKIIGQFYDPAYGSENMEDVRRLCKVVEQIDIELSHIGRHLVVNITLDSYLTDPKHEPNRK